MVFGDLPCEKCSPPGVHLFEEVMYQTRGITLPEWQARRAQRRAPGGAGGREWLAFMGRARRIVGPATGMARERS